LRRGTIEVCAIDTPQRCRTLSQPGDTVIGTPNVLDRPRRAGPGPSEFADRCLTARAIAPCGILASVQPTKSGSVEPTKTGSAEPTRSGSVVPGSVPPAPTRVYYDRVPRGNRVVYGSQNGSATNPTPPRGTPTPPNCYRDRRGCQASVPAKPGRVTDAKPYVPKQTTVTPKPAYATLAVKQAYVRPTMRQNFMRPVYGPAPTYNRHTIK
jgi:hypothetical protein